MGLFRDNGKENSGYHIILGAYRASDEAVVDTLSGVGH